MIEIRSHHLICLQNFKGYGYSKEFTDNFYDILKKLKRNTFVKITVSSDDICRKCPNLKNKRCEKESNYEEKILKTDKKVLKIIGIKSNSIKNYKKLKETLVKKIQESPDKILQVCIGCQWEHLCKYKL